MKEQADREVKFKTYKDAGVDIDAGNDANTLAKFHAKRTQKGDSNIVVKPGLFSGAYSIQGIAQQYKHPVIIQAIEGVDEGIEKLVISGKFADAGNQLMDKLVKSVGNNVQLLFASDYAAWGVLEPQIVGDFVEGIADRCIEEGMSLLGGETAEMPGVYRKGRPEIVATVVGIAERDNVQIPKSRKNVGVFDLSKILKKYRSPVLTSTIDGVGTKTMIGVKMNNGSTLVYDIGNHCADDLLMQGADPLFAALFVGMNEKNTLYRQIQSGIRKYSSSTGVDCIAFDSKVKRKTYKKHQYDIVGSNIGIVELDDIIDGSNTQEGDVIIGLASNGIHTNGFSLVRDVVFDQLKLTVDDYVPELECKLGAELLKPHRSYVREIRDLRKYVPVNGMAHITGGGFIDNIPRTLPKEFGAEIYRDFWPVPSIFTYLQAKGPIAQSEMDLVFNQGIGMVVVVSPEFKDIALNRLNGDCKKPLAYEIGKVVGGEHKVHFV